MAGGHNLITDSGHSFTLTNVNDKIVGGGGLGGEFALFVVNKAGGIINGNGSGTVGELDIVATVTNAGLIEGTTSRGVAIGGSASLTTNSGTIAALGTGAFAQILETTVVNSTTKALILASGNGAQISLVDVTISGGTLKSSAGGQITGFDSSTLSGTLKGGTIGAGAIIETSGGTAIVSGTVTNGGTLFASATGDLIEIASGAVVNGGVALIGDGIVEFAGSSGESVRFLSNGSGGLKIADTVGHTSAAAGCPATASTTGQSSRSMAGKSRHVAAAIKSGSSPPRICSPGSEQAAAALRLRENIGKHSAMPDTSESGAGTVIGDPADEHHLKRLCQLPRARTPLRLATSAAGGE
jgi:hypothetical protein